MFYFLTYTAKRKNAQRHIVSIYDTLEECINHPLLNTENPHQYYDLYNSKWELIKEGKR